MSIEHAIDENTQAEMENARQHADTMQAVEMLSALAHAASIPAAKRWVDEMRRTANCLA